jgi:hypothetical protein
MFPSMPAFAAPGESPILHPGDSLTAMFEMGGQVIKPKVKILTEERWKEFSPSRRRRWIAFKVGDTGHVVCMRLK